MRTLLVETEWAHLPQLQNSVRCLCGTSFLVFNFFHFFVQLTLFVPRVHHLLGEELSLHLVKLAFTQRLVVVVVVHLFAPNPIVQFFVSPLFLNALGIRVVVSLVRGMPILLLGHFLDLALRLFNVPNLLWVVGFLFKLMSLLALELSLLEPETAVFLLETPLFFTGLNNGFLMLLDLLIVLAPSLQHLFVQAVDLIAGLGVGLLRAETHQVGVAHDLEVGLRLVGVTGGQTRHQGMRVQQRVHLWMQGLIHIVLRRAETEAGP